MESNLFKKIALRIANVPTHDSFEIGESAGLDAYERNPIDEIVERVKEAVFGENEIPSERDFDLGFWDGFGRNNDLSGESRDVIEDLHIRPGKKALSELKDKLSKSGIYFG
jgi:hypothetical protein